MLFQVCLNVTVMTNEFMLMLITTTGPEKLTDTKDCLTFNQNAITASVLMSRNEWSFHLKAVVVFISILQCCLPFSSDAWVVSKYLIIFYCTAEERGNEADTSRAVSAILFYNITTLNYPFSKRYKSYHQLSLFLFFGWKWDNQLW